MLSSTSAQFSPWNQVLDDIASLTEHLRFVLRVANYTNQRALARQLAGLLTSTRNAAVEVTLIGKTDCGVLELAERVEAALPKVRTTVVEAPDYADFAADIVTRAKNSAAILFAVPALAPFFDETAEFIANQVGAHKDKVMLAAVAEEHEFSKELPPSLRGFSCCTQDELVPALSDLLARTQFAELQTGLRTRIRMACGHLLPVVRTFAEFLSMSQPQYLRQLDFIRKDLSALDVLAQKARQALDVQSRRALSDLNGGVQSLAQTMRQQAETTVHNAPLPKDILADQEKRTSLGRTIVAAARAAGYREFETRVQSIAMNLNSSRSLLLSTVDQLRAEAQARYEELALNLGPGLLAAWLEEASPGWQDKPLEFSFEAATGFPDLVMAAAGKVRAEIPELAFSSGWTSRIESVYRTEMITAAHTRWRPDTLDRSLVHAIDKTWKDAAERSSGMLIGRLETIVHAVSGGLASSRMESLELPKDETTRAKLGDAYRGFSADLEKVQSQVS